MSNEQLTKNKITRYTLRITHYVARITKIDTLISLLIFAAAFYAYTTTLAPTVIEGDAALFQFTPYVLGVTYPTGFPLYILLGKLWVTIFPFGEIAWRMNLLSALCSSVTLPILYNAARRLFNYQLSIINYQLPITTYNSFRTQNSKFKINRWAALLTVLTFATLPTFWRWSTEAKTYALNILLFSCLLYLLARALDTDDIRSFTHSPFDLSRRYPLALPLLLLGLMISVHNTGILLIPGVAVTIWLHFRRYINSLKSMLLHLILLAIPGLFYLYIPLRAEWLIAHYGRQEAINRGLLADFYHSGLDGLIRYFSGVGFTEGVVSNWGLVPQQFFTVYLPLLTEDLTRLGVALGIIGGLGLAITRPRLFAPLFLMYAVPIPFVIVYGQGEQSAFLLPSFLIFCIFVGNTINLLGNLIALTSTRYNLESRREEFRGDTPQAPRPAARYALRTTHYALRIIPPLAMVALVPTLFLLQIQHNVTWLTIKWDRAIYNEWADALNHPLESEAGMLAHWGDLTSFWYMQHAEGRRPDLRGVYPPTEERVINWFEQGHGDLYIAGPLQGWVAGIQDRYHLIPWGRLVRIAPQQIDPQQLLPQLKPVGATFGDQLHLIGVEAAPQAVAGRDFPITLTWQTLAELPPETTVSLRFSQNGLIVTQLDDRLRSGWFPSETLPAHQQALSYALLPVPLGTLPGDYHLQLVTYANANTPWPLTYGSTVLDLGPVEIVPFPANESPNTDEFKPLPPHDFNGEIQLAGYNYSVARVGQGKGFAIELLWQVRTRPKDNYTLLVEALDADGNLLRAVEHQPVEGRAPTASWQAGHFVRDQVDFVVPASAPPGEDALQIRLSWLRPDGSKLNLRRWKLLPWGDGLKLGWLNVTPKTDRSFEIPAIDHPIDANLENKVRLLGYNIALPATDSPGTFQLDASACKSEGCTVDIDFYWQGIREMESLYRMFLHVVDDEGQIVTQHDGVPGRGKHPTTGWLPDEVIIDPVDIALPADIATGQYTLRVGMYLPPDGPRLAVVDESNQLVSDFLDIASLVISK